MLSQIAPIVTTSWDDGHPLDRKIADLLNRYSLPGTFYAPLKNSENPVMSHPYLREIGKEFEIGGHTMNHVYLDSVGIGIAEKEIREGKEALENVLGYEVGSFAYPGGKYNYRIRCVVRETGFRIARTTRFLHFDLPKNALEMHTGWIIGMQSDWIISRHLLYRFNPRGFLPYLHARAKSSNWVGFVCSLFDWWLERKSTIFHIWGHSWEIEQLGLWSELEKIFRYISNRSSVQYVCNGKLSSL